MDDSDKPKIELTERSCKELQIPPDTLADQQQEQGLQEESDPDDGPRESSEAMVVFLSDSLATEPPMQDAQVLANWIKQERYRHVSLDSQEAAEAAQVDENHLQMAASVFGRMSEPQRTVVLKAARILGASPSCLRRRLLSV